MDPIILNSKWRINCLTNPPQWTLERKHVRAKGDTWDAVSFCQKRETLLRVVREKVIHGAEFYKASENCAVPSDIITRIENFPEQIDAGWIESQDAPVEG